LFPALFDSVPTIFLHDPLAAFIGVSDDGIMTYCYADAVKLAGHSVAGAYLMVRKGLALLYADRLPERGRVEVHMRDNRERGTTGVVAAIATLLTGAAPETGFGGIGTTHRFARRDLPQFDAPIDGMLALRRRDTGRGVVVDMDSAGVPPARDMLTLLPRAVTGQTNESEQARFGALWQERVERMLIEHADDPALVHAREWDAVRQ
jgi:hypothetical protein